VLVDGFVIGRDGGVDIIGEDVLGPEPDWVLLLLLGL